MQSDVSIATERRIEARWPAAGAPFVLWSPMLHVRPELVDFNTRGLAFRVPASTSIEAGSVVPLVLQNSRAVPLVHLTARAGSLKPESGKLRVGGPIEDFAPAIRHSFWVPSTGDVVTVPLGVHREQILSAARKHGTRATLFWPPGQQSPIVFCETPRDAVSGSVYLASQSEIDASRAETARVLFSVYGACFALEGKLSRDHAGRLHLAPPLDLLSLSRRRHDRTLPGTGKAVVRWRHPLDPSRDVVAAVHDLSPCGLGILARIGEAPFPPAERCSLTLELLGERVELEGELVHVSSDGPLVRFGFRTSAPHWRDTVRVARLCRAVRFPHLSARASARPTEVDDLFRESGYLALRSGMSPPTEWHKAIGDERISLDTVHRSADGRVDGHLSCLRVYRNTWMYHQLATAGQSREARECRRALYLDTASFVSFLGGDTWYSLAYFDRNKSWHRLLFDGFVKWVGSEALAAIVALDRFECSGTPHEAPLLPSPMSIGPLKSAEASDATALVARTLPPLAIEAMDMTEALIAQDLLCSTLFAAAGRERGRYPVALRERNRLVGVALCDIGSRELSLFNLVNIAHIFLEPEMHSHAQVAFLEHIRAFYERRGINDPIIVSPAGTVTQAGDAGLALAETMGAFVVSAAGFKQYRNFLTFCLSRHARVEPSNLDATVLIE